MRGFGKQDDSERPFGGRVQGFRGAVATEHYLSAQAGMDILKEGGNAFDAAAAATMVENVVNPHMFTIGGECPMLLYSPTEGRVVSVNGNTQAPQRATLEAYIKRGLDPIPPEGVFASGVPAAFSALGEMLIRYGSLPLEIILEPAWLLARDGFPAHDGLLHMPRFSLEDNCEKFVDRWPASAELYLDLCGTLPMEGQRMRNPGMAHLLDLLSGASRRNHNGGRDAGIRKALEAFYQGDAASEMVAFARKRDGFLRESDLSDFRTYFENPVSAEFRGIQVFKCGPWSQGPVFLQLLKLVEGFDLEGMKHQSADYLHLWIEAAKLAYADREQFYGDPRQVTVPLEGLLGDDYTRRRRTLIDKRRANRDLRPGDPNAVKALLPAQYVFKKKSWGYGTVHVAVVDAEGNMAALTPSGGWISGNEVIPSLGFPLTTRLQTFYLDAAHPNVLAPGKRPRTTLSPSLAFRKGRPWMVFGTMGGDQQDQWTSQFFLNMTVFGMSLQEAIEAPKITSHHFPGTFHPHDAFPGRVGLEGRFPDSLAHELSRLGHNVQMEGEWSAGYICAVSRNEEGLLEAGCDPRGRKASVFPSCALSW